MLNTLNLPHVDILPPLPELNPSKSPIFSSVSLPPAPPPPVVKALYIHVPFCSAKCHYCDFYSLAGHLDRANDYLNALEREFQLIRDHFSISIFSALQTIFIGGGTPTLLSPPHLQRLMKMIAAYVDISHVEEFSIEANPNTFCRERATILAQAGVNRISFGAQSFVPEELKILQRDHDPDNVPRAFELARDAGLHNLNVDLIFGIPGQTLASWDYSLTQALELKPDHLSAYSLIYEPNTPMTARMKKGEFAIMEESLELDMFQRTYEILSQIGLKRYETSNHARPGRECKHNLHYWTGSSWLALGPSAASGYGLWRWKNSQNLMHYLDLLNGPSPRLPVTQLEKLSPLQRAGELVMLWLRLTQGIRFDDFQAACGVDLRPSTQQLLEKIGDLGLIHSDEQHIRLTDKGVPLSDGIIRELVARM